MSEAMDSAARFHVEHVVALQHGGGDGEENLALACQRCNLFKGPNLSGIDPETGEVVRLFHPRAQGWAEHFQLRRGRVVGVTATGRATVQVLSMNDAVRVALRRLC